MNYCWDVAANYCAHHHHHHHCSVSTEAGDDNDDDDGRIGCDSGSLYSFECVTMKVLMRFHGYSPGKLATKYWNQKLRKYNFMHQDRAIKSLRKSPCLGGVTSSFVNFTATAYMSLVLLFSLVRWFTGSHWASPLPSKMVSMITWSHCPMSTLFTAGTSSYLRAGQSTARSVHSDKDCQQGNALSVDLTGFLQGAAGIMSQCSASLAPAHPLPAACHL